MSRTSTITVGELKSMHGAVSWVARACVFLARCLSICVGVCACVSARAPEERRQRLGKISLGLSHALCMS